MAETLPESMETEVQGRRGPIRWLLDHCTPDGVGVSSTVLAIGGAAYATRLAVEHGDAIMPPEQFDHLLLGIGGTLLGMIGIIKARENYTHPPHSTSE